jgi:hypothetical protein
MAQGPYYRSFADPPQRPQKEVEPPKPPRSPNKSKLEKLIIYFFLRVPRVLRGESCISWRLGGLGG